MREFRKKLWFFAFLFFVVFDLATTFVGMEFGSVSEANPYFEFAYENNQYVILASFKVGIFTFLVFLDVIMKFIEREFLGNTPIPLIPFIPLIAGMEVTIVNLEVLLSAGATIDQFVFATLAILLPSYLAMKMYEMKFNKKALS